jgi:hypothetical protein
VSNDRPTLPTRVGHAEWGDNRFRGYSVARDLAGHEGMTGLLALAIAGRRLDDNERLMLDDLATVTTVADPRIWPLKLVRITAAYGGCNAAVAALMVGLEGAPIGYHASGRAAEFLLRLHDGLLAEGSNVAETDDAVFEAYCRRLVGDTGRPFGFEVPFRERDERVDMLADRVAARGRRELPHWRLFVKAAEVFWRISGVRPNIPVAMSAVCLDMGFTPAQIGPLMTAMGACAFWANAFEGAEQAPACLQNLPAECVRYVGPAPRLSPRAVDARSK